MSLTVSLPVLLSERWDHYAEACQISPCVWRLRHKATSQWHYLKFAEESIQRQLLNNEVYWLQRLSGHYLPDIIAASNDTAHSHSRHSHSRHSHSQHSCSRTPIWLITHEVPGQPLNQLIRSNQINRSDYRAIISDLFVALQHSHQQGVVHSDIKPANLIWCQKSQRLSLIDWGSAGRAGSLISQQPWRSFSLSYSPPSLQRGEGYITPLVDWYSFLIMDQLLRQKPLPAFDWQQSDSVSGYYLEQGYCPVLSEKQRAFLLEAMKQLDRFG
ncbi:MAG: hypothetical protein CMI12_14910 [Oceanospirillum sp.]|nr:hypothetical protein [Oceanospirillum sp.]